MIEREYTTWKRWDGYARRVEGAFLRKYGKSLSFSSIPNGAKSHIIEMYCENDTMIVKPGWKQAMLKYTFEHLGLFGKIPETLAQV